MKAEIIAVGTELLIGDILNTNAQFLSQRLFALGIDMYYQTVAGDNAGRLTEAIAQAFSRADLVVFSGGLGPTDDDLTKEAVAEYFHLPLLFHKDIAENIKQYLHGRCPESNMKQAYVPEGAKVLQNRCGTAPGLMIEQDGKTAILLPGPPNELEPMFSQEVEPFLRSKSGGMVMAEQYLRVCGIGEARVGEMLSDLMEGGNPSLAPYAKENEVQLRIAAKAATQTAAEAEIETMRRVVEERLGDAVYAYGEQDMPHTVGKLLLEEGLTIACAESCTAGLLTAALGDVAGISAALHEGIVTYSNEAKMKYLGVSADTLAVHGAVSAETAREMALGIRRVSGSDIGVSVTGIAGPDGGTAEKPVGLVYVGIACYGEVETLRLQLHGSRQRVRRAAVMQALNGVRKQILKDKKNRR